MRQFLVIAHRWAGLITAAFLIVAGLTGSILAFEEELDTWLNPQLFVVAPPRDGAGNVQAMLDPFELRGRAQAALPDYFVNLVRFQRKPDRAQVIFLRAKPGMEARADQAFIDPYSGRVLGVRKSGESLFRRETVVGFIYRLHYSLALPEPWGDWLFGGIALVWTLDCFIGFFLTFPRGRPFWSKWSVAWKIKQGAAAARLNLDLHRAFGLWLWAMLLIYAWSSVMLNLRQEVYRPVMSTMFRFAELPNLPARAEPLDTPSLDWRAAAAAGKAAMVQLAQQKKFEIYYDDAVFYNRNSGVYQFSANTSRDLVRDRGQTIVYLDGNTGAVLGSRIQTGEAAGDTISRWLQSLHMRQIFGRPYQIFVAIIGVIIAMLSVTGVIVWWHKRTSRRRSAALRESRSLETLPQLSSELSALHQRADSQL